MTRGRPVNEAEEEEEEARRLEIVDMSGMGLDSLPNPSPLNIGSIGKLDLSSNNLQVNILLLLLYSYIQYITLSIFFNFFFGFRFSITNTGWA